MLSRLSTVCRITSEDFYQFTCSLGIKLDADLLLFVDQSSVYLLGICVQRPSF